MLVVLGLCSRSASADNLWRVVSDQRGVLPLSLAHNAASSSQVMLSASHLLLQIRTKMLDDDGVDLSVTALLGSACFCIPALLSGLPFFPLSSCSGSSHLERQLLTSRVHVQRIAMLDVRSQ